MILSDFNFDVLTSWFICWTETLVRMLLEAVLPVTSLLVSMSFFACLICLYVFPIIGMFSCFLGESACASACTSQIMYANCLSGSTV